MKELCIGASPQGKIGRILGHFMNAIHSHQYFTIIREISDNEKGEILNILDIGCGGGIAIKHFSRVFKEAHIYGIDRSIDMVHLAKRVNRKGIKTGKVEILNGDVELLRIPEKTIHLISVFDTINFWDNHTKALSEMKRVLTQYGRLLIVNGYPEEGTKWYDFVKFKNIEDYDILLKNNGFEIAKHEIKNRTIIIKAKLC